MKDELKPLDLKARTPAAALIVHGGCGRHRAEKMSRKEEALQRAMAAGRSLLDRGAPALDAVVKAVKVLEDDPHFNAGTGSYLNLEGVAEMDASVMTGGRRCGAVGAIQDVRYPVEVARLVMERTDHVLICGAAALDFARRQGIPPYDPVTPECRERWQQLRQALEGPDSELERHPELRHWKHLPDLFRSLGVDGECSGGGREHGTVGAVARDARGGLAVATSTGGIWMRLPGRLGDTAVIGAGTWAAPQGAASATGHGEGIIRVGLARTAVDLMSEAGAAEAVRRALELARVEGVEAGLIGIDAQGEIGWGCTAQAMPVAWDRLPPGKVAC